MLYYIVRRVLTMIPTLFAAAQSAAQSPSFAAQSFRHLSGFQM